MGQEEKINVSLLSKKQLIEIVENRMNAGFSGYETYELVEKAISDNENLLRTELEKCRLEIDALINTKIEEEQIKLGELVRKSHKLHKKLNNLYEKHFIK